MECKTNLKVCFILWRDFPSNFSTDINEYARGLAKSGVDVSVICAKWDDKYDDYEFLDGVHVYRVRSKSRNGLSLSPTLFGYRSFRKLEEIHQSKKIDVMHVVGFPNLGMAIHPPPWMDTPRTKVLDIRGTAVSNSVADYISRVGIRFQSLFYKHIVTLSEEVGSSVLPSTCGYKIIPLGADMDRFSPDTDEVPRCKYGIDEDSVLLIYVGNFHPSRRLERLLGSFKKAVNANSDIELLMVGSGGDVRNLRNKAHTYGIDEKVTFTGFVPFSEVPKYISMCDIGISYIPDKPQYRDQPPIKTVEYLASGLPVIGTNTRGNQMYVNSKNGILVDDNMEKLAKSIITLSRSTKRREKMSSHARPTVCEYDYSNIVNNKLIPYYKSILQQ